MLAAGAAAAAANNFETAGRHLAALVSDLEEEPEEEQAIAVAPVTLAVSLPLAHYSPSHLEINTLSD